MESDDEELVLNVNRKKNSEIQVNTEEAKSLLSDLDSNTEHEQETNTSSELIAPQLNTLSSLISNSTSSQSSSETTSPSTQDTVINVPVPSPPVANTTEEPNRTFRQSFIDGGRFILSSFISSSIWRKGNYITCLYLIPLTLAMGTVLIVDWKKQCDRPLRIWALISVVMQLCIILLNIYIVHILPPPPPPPGSPEFEEMRSRFTNRNNNNNNNNSNSRNTQNSSNSQINRIPANNSISNSQNNENRQEISPSLERRFTPPHIYHRILQRMQIHLMTNRVMLIVWSLWFVIGGATFTFSSSSCSRQAPFLFRMSFTIVIIQLSLIGLMMLIFGCIGFCGCFSQRRGYRIRFLGGEEEAEDIIDLLGSTGTSRWTNRGPRPLRLDKLIVKKFTAKNFSEESPNIQIQDDLVYIINEDANCAICLQNYEENEEIRFLNCATKLSKSSEAKVKDKFAPGHHFHKICIDQWLKTYNTYCPICKQSMET